MSSNWWTCTAKAGSPSRRSMSTWRGRTSGSTTRSWTRHSAPWTGTRGQRSASTSGVSREEFAAKYLQREKQLAHESKICEFYPTWNSSMRKIFEESIKSEVRIRLFRNLSFTPVLKSSKSGSDRKFQRPIWRFIRKTTAIRKTIRCSSLPTT